MAVCYVPNLKWKRGEQIALSKLSDTIKDTILPVTCLMSKNYDSIIGAYKRHWPSREFILDFHRDSKMLDAEKIIAIDKFTQAGLSFILAVNPLTSKSVVAKVKSIVLRIDAGLDFDKVVKPFIDSCGIMANNIDIIIDAPWLLNYSNSIPVITKLISDVILKVSDYEKGKKQKFRRLIFAGSSFPETLSGLKPLSVTSIKRIEWEVWQSLLKTNKRIIFGDYGSDDPYEIEIDPTKGVTIIPTIRYTHDNSWYIIRGKLNRDNKFDFPQFHQLSKILVKEKFYCGARHCWGDNEINSCANTACTGVRNCNHGNLESWVKIAINHHISFVAHQAANQVGAP